MTKKKIKGWAIITKRGSLCDNYGSGNNTQLLVYRNQKSAVDNKRFEWEEITPCEITYQLPLKKARK